MSYTRVMHMAQLFKAPTSRGRKDKDKLLIQYNAHRNLDKEVPLIQFETYWNMAHMGASLIRVACTD